MLCATVARTYIYVEAFWQLAAMACNFSEYLLEDELLIMEGKICSHTLIKK